MRLQPMMVPLKVEYDELRATMLEAIVDALEQETSLGKVIAPNEAGELPFTAVSLDVAPWHSWLGMSFRTPKESYGEHRYRPEEWRLFDLINSENSPSQPFRKLANYIAYLYAEGETADHQARAHFLFLAGAEALLDEQVQAALQAHGIAAPLITDSFVSSSFEYLVFDPDETLRANYCEIVLSLRLQARFGSTE